MLSSTNQFIECLNNFPFYSNDQLVSFDVKSLFTNVPLHETIKIISDYLYSDTAVCTPPFNKKILIKIMKLAIQGMFLYKNKLWKQIDGVAMGSPLGPTLANFFLAHLEQKMFNNVSDIQPKFYRRYVDDIFAVF